MKPLQLTDPSKQVNHLTQFIYDTVTNAGKSTAIVAISGGIDSTLSLSLTAQALKPSHVYSLHLPTKSSHPIHTQHVKAAEEAAKIPKKNRLHIPINAITQKSWRIIKRYSPSQPSLEKGVPKRTQLNAISADALRLRLANITARSRMLVLYDQAKRLDALVVGTENYSEHLLGYFTRFGDEASDLEPLKHLYKTQVIQIAKHVKIPTDIIDKQPSADLWPGQTDAKELGFTYQQADPILYLHSQGKSNKQIIAAGHDKKLVTAVLGVVEKNTFKQHTPYIPTAKSTNK